jgi:hypothetical protein
MPGTCECESRKAKSQCCQRRNAAKGIYAGFVACDIMRLHLTSLGAWCYEHPPQLFVGALHVYLSASTRLPSKPLQELCCNSCANQSVRRNLAGFLPQHWFTYKTTGCCSTDTDRGTDERKVLRNSRQRVGGRSHNRGDALVHRVNILSYTKALKIRCNWLIRKVKQPLGLTRRDAAVFPEVGLLHAQNRMGI